MGPILIFDKSFLESLTLDESVLLDNFFLINITPIFFVETLADLEKKYKKGKIKRTSNELVKELASKTPDNGTPNVHHQTLVIQDLLGHYVEMSSRIIVAGGQTRISPDGKVGVFFEGFPEYIALERWRYGDYLEGEKDFAKEWRSTLLNVSFNWGINQIKEILPKGIRFSSVEQVRDFVNNYIKKRNIEVLYLLFEILQIPYATRISILTRWNRSRPESLLQFSRYASYVFKIDLFFYICLQFGRYPLN